MIVLALINILAMDDYFKTALTSIFYNSKHFYWWTPQIKNYFKDFNKLCKLDAEQ